MNYFELIRARRSVRVYHPQPVDEEKLKRILEAANQAPSAGNLQAYQILIVSRTSSMALLSEGDKQQIT